VCGVCIHTYTRVLYTAYVYILFDKGRGGRGNGTFPRRGFELKAIDPRRDTNPGCLLSTNLAICHGVSHRERRFRPRSPSWDFSTRRRDSSESGPADCPQIPRATGRIFGTSLCIADWRPKFQIAQLYDICDIPAAKDDRSKHASRNMY